MTTGTEARVEHIKEKMAEINRTIEQEKKDLASTTERHLKTIQQLENARAVVKLLPEDVLMLDWSVSSYTSYNEKAHLHFRNNNGENKDLIYATLFDAGFEFPQKPNFSEYSQRFFKSGKLTVSDPFNGDIVVGATVYIEQPPSCKIVKTKKRKTVEVIEAICEETGEVL